MEPSNGVRITQELPEEITNALGPPGYLYKDELDNFKETLNLDRIKEELRKHIPKGMKITPADAITAKRIDNEALNERGYLGWLLRNSSLHKSSM